MASIIHDLLLTFVLNKFHKGLFLFTEEITVQADLGRSKLSGSAWAGTQASASSSSTYTMLSVKALTLWKNHFNMKEEKPPPANAAEKTLFADPEISNSLSGICPGSWGGKFEFGVVSVTCQKLTFILEILIV